MNLIKELKDRGIINNVTDEKKLQEAIDNKLGVYIGFDPSFRSLHLGNYIMIHLLNLFAKAGLPTYAVLGGATGRIGDPSGKKAERSLLDLKVLDANIEAVSKQLKTLANVKEVVNNYDIYKNISLFTFLRNVGKLINVNYLLEKDIIKTRLESGISFAEFSYNLIQGYDFVWLYNYKGVAIQCGGSDQWGNITTGLEMIRKVNGDKAKAVGLTINLLTKSDGTKFGKSEKGAIYLDPTITSPYEMYQFILNQADEDLNKMFNFFSDLSTDDIKTLLAKHNENKGARLGQKTLAQEIITKIHGKDAYDQCLKISDALFYGKFDQLTLSELDICAKQFNLFKINQEMNLVDFLIENKIIQSKRVFRELLQAKTLLVNNIVVDKEDFKLTNKLTYFDKYTIIRKGKKNYFMLTWK
ncbi:MAG: tyrosine--tRNA ligase [Mycoplasma sp.]|nr:tyrosine--tRNA ligase [Candidatus Hennigella equi]